MIHKQGFLLFFIFSLLYTNITTAQTDTLIKDKAVSKAQQVYFNGIADQAAKFNGSQYQGYLVSFQDGHPYFKFDYLSKGSITYDGLIFENLNLLYDEVLDCVVFQDNTHRIQLVNERLSEFSIEGYNFERLVKKDNSPLINTGFYQVLSKGKINLYKKETKRIIDKITNTNELTVLFEVHQYYYILQGDQFYPINRKKDLIKHFSVSDPKFIKWIKSTDLNFRKDKERSLTKVIDYYNLQNQ
jgi:hypothetical protein